MNLQSRQLRVIGERAFRSTLGTHAAVFGSSLLFLRVFELSPPVVPFSPFLSEERIH